MNKLNKYKEQIILLSADSKQNLALLLSFSKASIAVFYFMIINKI